MRLISWNVNGIRAAVRKDFINSLQTMQPDILCLQETKAQDEQVHQALSDLDGFHIHPCSAERPGYSGTAVLTRQAPLELTTGMGIQEHDREGRVINAHFDGFTLITVYTPNAGNGLRRLDYREQWDQAFLEHVQHLEATQPVIICGDLNVCHRDIDIARPKANYNKSAGYTQREIDGLDRLLEAGYIDSFRSLHPDTVKYSWWSMRAGARERNVGWRLDYFLVSKALQRGIVDADILDQVSGSDHCPVMLDFEP